MTKRNLFLAILLVTTTAAISITAVLLWSRSRSQPSWASQTSSAPVNSSAAVAQLKSHAPGAAKEGIKVHGSWTIDILRSDGRLFKHHKFENDLQGGGAASLGQFLQRTSKAGEWSVVVGVGPDPVANSPCINGSVLKDCVIYEPASQNTFASQPQAFKTLTIGSRGDPLNENKTVLSGTATAQRNGQITFVATHLSRCPVETQGVCSGSAPMFTWAFPSAIPVVAGQIIQVTVVISFS